MTGPDDLPYRDCVGALILNRGGRAFAGRRLGGNEGLDHAWQMPQGGIDPGETPAMAALRELTEETGITADLVEPIAEHPEWLYYDLPAELIGVAWKGRYRGQRQRWFAYRFLGTDDDIDLSAGPKPEFSDWRWVPIEDLPKLIVPFKRLTYEQVVAAFRHLATNVGGNSQ